MVQIHFALRRPSCRVIESKDEGHAILYRGGQIDKGIWQDPAMAGGLLPEREGPFPALLLVPKCEGFELAIGTAAFLPGKNSYGSRLLTLKNYQ